MTEFKEKDNLQVDDSVSEDELKKEEVLLGLMRSRYDQEWQRIKDLDGKAGNLIGYVSVITGLLIGIGTFDVLGKLTLSNYYLVYFSGVTLLLISICLALLAMRVRNWESAPTADYLRNLLYDDQITYSFVLSQLIVRLGEVVNLIELRTDSKANKVKMSFYFLGAGLIVLFIYLLVFILENYSQ